MSQELILTARLAHIKGCAGVLSAIKQSRKQAGEGERPKNSACCVVIEALPRPLQVATVLVDSDGLVVYTFDDSRTLQGSALLRTEARAVFFVLNAFIFNLVHDI